MAVPASAPVSGARRAVTLALPHLFALFVPLALYARNSSDVHFIELAPPLGIVMAASVTAQALLAVLRVDLARASVVLAAFWVMFFFFSPLAGFVGTAQRALVLTSVGGVCLLLVVFRLRIETVTAIARALAVVGVLLLLNPIRVLIQESVTWGAARAAAVPVAKAAPPDSSLPDIYYVILDGYASRVTLSTHFGFDNHEFLDTLSARGFYVANDSRSNYWWTIRSLPSSMNMDYIESLEAEAGGELKHRALRNLIFDGKVARRLKEAGYTFHSILSTSAMRPSDVSVVDEYLEYSGLSPYAAQLVSFTPLKSFRLTRRLFFDYTIDDRGWAPESIPWAFDQLERLGREPGPKLVFAHILSPHAPYYHDASCNLIESNRDRYWIGYSGEWEPYRAAYLDQLRCVNRHVTELLGRLENQPGRPAPIMVLQGDHGPPEIKDKTLLGKDPNINLAEFRSRILNAYRVPPEVASQLYPSISPVNTFRLIFSYLFHTNYPLLENRSLSRH